MGVCEIRCPLLDGYKCCRGCSNIADCGIHCKYSTEDYIDEDCNYYTEESKDE